MIRRLIGRGIDAYFKHTFSDVAPPASIETFTENQKFTLRTFIYPSSEDNEDSPALALFHGGGWHHGNPWQLAAIARDLSACGITVYLPEYRVASRDNASVADGLSDISCFLDWMMARHPNSPIHLGGSSAGAYLAANVGLTTPHSISGLVLLNPALNLDPKCIKRFWPLLEQPKGFMLDEFLAIDPVHDLDAATPPTIILHGTKDFLVPLSWVNTFVTKMNAAGGNFQMVMMEGYGHGLANGALFPNAHKRVVENIRDFVFSKYYG